MPESYPSVRPDYIKSTKPASFHELAFLIARKYFIDEFGDNGLYRIARRAFDFDIPLKHLKDDIHVLELFHGPTLAFKDVGARFMAHLMAEIKSDDDEITILVATSGDTGGAVASGFHGVDNINVVVLYPEGKVSKFQERQFTTLGDNINCLAVEGTFDDCQRLVKAAFMDEDLRRKIRISSANSINIGRWLPQSFYYAWAWYQWDKINPGIEPAISVPSGNYGNLTAGMLAGESGIPIKKIIAGSNRNNSVPVYLDSGIYKPKETIQTIANAMDVGDPSNFERMKYLGKNRETIRSIVSAFEFQDHEILDGIVKVYEDTGYILDPHSATACLALEKSKQEGIFLATAHPVKFLDVMPEEIKDKVRLPSHFKESDKASRSIRVSADYGEFREHLLQL